MSALDSILKQVSGSPDTVASLAAQVGLDPALVEKGLAALGQAHDEPGDTVEHAAQKSPLDTGALQAIVAQLGGESALGEMASKVEGSDQISGFAAFLDRDGDGSAIDDIAGIASGLFGRK
ncbi:hypothetical protein CD351_06610 [Erythrobacter sp. KY5]|uniref:hypothetical protein n=1 Tax=Erythrobacter sp. KY5 TaxID=2011159 RepID=UPI000DBF0DC8|nr:hypothetical protein [Erythrobacter sp. KY5]AWW74097.1 hypothetical protein CD351_06610 [Erythrobacter sp. KY5]